MPRALIGKEKKYIYIYIYNYISYIIGIYNRTAPHRTTQTAPPRTAQIRPHRTAPHQRQRDTERGHRGLVCVCFGWWLVCFIWFVCWWLVLFIWFSFPEPNFRYTTILANAIQRLRDVSFNQRQMQRAEAKAKAALTF